MQPTLPPALPRVLVVDDNIDAADAMAMFLESLGAEVRTVYDGLAAVEAAEAFRPDLVLLDLGLPRLDGCEVARRMRAASWGKAMKLVALTGWSREEDKQRTREAGFDGHIVKPVKFETLELLLADGPTSLLPAGSLR